MGAKVLKKREINKKPRAFRSWLFIFLLLLGLKIALAYTTYWANPIIWKILECCSWSDATVWIAFCWIVNVSADFTYVLHNSFCF
jgi:membrane-bound metal-dependent hydrolase YbcI (DUF457 family)